MYYFDAHTHVQLAAFEEDYKEVVQRALDADVWFMNVGTQRDTSKQAVVSANQFPEGVYAAVGLHPVHTDKSHHDAKELGGGEAAKAFTGRGEEFDFEYYRLLALDQKVLAIGECGLDYYRLEGTKEEKEEKIHKQKDAFLRQLELGKAVGKPMMIHCRQAAGDLVELLKNNIGLLDAANPGVIHFYTDGIEEAKQLLELGFSFSLGGVVTFARDYDEMIKMMPLDRILSETDAPYVAPVPHRGKRNEPAYVIETVKKLAELKGIEPEKMKGQIWENSRRVLRIS